MYAKHEEKLNNFSDSFASKIRGREEETKKNYIQTNEHIKPIVLLINEQDIIGIISCQEKREMNDFIRQQTVNLIGRVIGKIIGIGIKEVDNTEHYYLVLTNEHLHYIHYSNKGECKEHLSFQNNQLTNWKTGKVRSGDMIKNNAFAGNTQKLSFDSNGTTYKFFVYDKMYAHPLAGHEHSNSQEISEINYLFAKPFKKFMEQHPTD
jgi:hypothetical protein